MTSNQITIALIKGRIEKDAVTLLEKAGFNTVSYTHLTLPTICSV